MILKKIAKMTLIGCAVLALASCSTMKKGSHSGDVNDIDGSNGVQTSGAGDESSFGGEGSGRSVAKNTYYFDFNKSDIRPSDRPGIIANANKLVARQDQKVIIEGHTDPRGSREYNVALAERRANAVSNVLKSKGVSHSQVRTVSYGSQRPAAQGNTEEDYQLDRRAVIDYVR